MQLNNFKEAEDAICADWHRPSVTNDLIDGLFRILDVSFNRLREIRGLAQLHKLEKLFLCANKISHIENLSHLKNLTLLELGDNKIRASGSDFSTVACFFCCCPVHRRCRGTLQQMQAFCVMKLLS